MSFPPFLSRVYVQMAQRTSVGRCWWFGWDTFLLLHMSLKCTLRNSLLASGTLFIVLAILTLPNLVGCINRNFNRLFALFANHQHGTGVVQVQIFVIFILEFFIESLAKLTYIFWVSHCFWWGNFDKLVLCWLELLSPIFYWYFLSLSFFVSRERSFIMIAVILPSALMEFFLYGFDYLRSKSLQKWLHTRISDFI